MKITQVNVYLVGPNKSEAAQPPDHRKKMNWLGESVISNPMSSYPEYFDRRSSWSGMGQRVIVVIETDAGVSGLGESVGGTATAAIIKQHLTKLLVGQNPFQIEKLWDIMFKVTLPYGRKGLPIMAISAVDLALWDCISKARNEPLHQSLGGAVRDTIQAYVTGNEYSTTKENGFYGQKLAMPYGPASGLDGMYKNVEHVRQARETLGPDLEIMLDCYMSWTVDYTIRMAELLVPYRVKWIEEALPPDDYTGYALLNEKIQSTTIATGEHEYTHYGFQALMEKRGAEILQPDICWVGGLTPALKIAAMAQAQYLSVIPHGGGLQPWAVHYVFSQTNTPLAEYFVGSDIDKDPIYEGGQVPINGWFHLPQAIGAGITLRESASDYLYEV